MRRLERAGGAGPVPLEEYFTFYVDRNRELAWFPLMQVGSPVA